MFSEDNVEYVSSVQLLSHVRLFVTPWAPHRASLSITNSRSLLKLMLVKSVVTFMSELSSNSEAHLPDFLMIYPTLH